MQYADETKHLILFADAADAEEPGDFRSYLAKATAAALARVKRGRR